MSDWTVEFYSDERGRAPAEKFIYSLDLPDQNALFRALELLEEFGLEVTDAHVKPVKHGKKLLIWELRARAGRLFYFSYTGRRFIILHGYKKQSRKARGKEIETALKRRADFEEREKG